MLIICHLIKNFNSIHTYYKSDFKKDAIYFLLLNIKLESIFLIQNYKKFLHKNFVAKIYAMNFNKVLIKMLINLLFALLLKLNSGIFRMTILLIVSNHLPQTNNFLKWFRLLTIHQMMIF